MVYLAKEDWETYVYLDTQEFNKDFLQHKGKLDNG